MATANNNATLDLVGLGAEQYTDVLSGKSGDIHERMNEIAHGAEIDQDIVDAINAKPDNLFSTTSDGVTTHAFQPVSIADTSAPNNSELSKLATGMIDGLTSNSDLTRDEATALMQKALSGGHLKKAVVTNVVTTNGKASVSYAEAEKIIKDLIKDDDFRNGLSLGQLTKLSTLMQYDQSIYDMIAASIKALLANVKKNANQLGGG
jgi:hypothetical protein